MFSFIGLHRPTKALPRRTAAARRQAAAPAPTDPSEPRASCGWFDSSWDLRRGLEVIEHVDFERLPPEVPLAWMLQ